MQRKHLQKSEIQHQFRVRRTKSDKSISQLTRAQSKIEPASSLSLARRPVQSRNKLLPLSPLRQRHNPQKLTTEPIAIVINSKTKRLTEGEEQLLPRVDPKLALVKKFSQDNPAYNLRRSTTINYKAYTRFHEADRQSPPPHTKKFKDFSYKDRYYDINRRLLQQTNIHLSADAWVAFDYNEAKYIRGWKVQAVGTAQNLTKLLLINTTLKVLKRMELDPALLRIQILVPSEAKSHTQDRSLALHDNSQISFLEMMYGLMITSTLELYDHLLLNLGYLLYCEHQKSHDHALLEAILSHMMVVVPRKQRDKDHLYTGECLAEMRHTIQELKMLCTELCANEHYQMITCCIDLCILTVDSLEYPQFRPMMAARSHTSSIRFQTGFNFSQERKVKWTTSIPWDTDTFVAVCSGWRQNRQACNNSMVAYHRQTDIIVVLFDSRFHFRTEDASKVVEWCVRNMKDCRQKTYLQECRRTFMLNCKHVHE